MNPRNISGSYTRKTRVNYMIMCRQASCPHWHNTYNDMFQEHLSQFLSTYLYMRISAIRSVYFTESLGYMYFYICILEAINVLSTEKCHIFTFIQFNGRIFPTKLAWKNPKADFHFPVSCLKGVWKKISLSIKDKWVNPNWSSPQVYCY